MKVLVTKVWTDEENFWLETTDNWQCSYPFAFWDVLVNATQEQRKNVRLVENGIIWPILNFKITFNELIDYFDGGLSEILSYYSHGLNDNNGGSYHNGGYDNDDCEYGYDSDDAVW